MQYVNSKQRENWLFKDQEAIQQCKQHSLDEAIFRLRSTNEFSEEDLVTAEEERDLVNFNLGKLLSLAGKNTALKVGATACAFFKRFYLHNSIFDHPVNDVLFTCLFVAFKSEEELKTIKEFIDGLNLNEETKKKKRETLPKIIMALELVIVEQMQFHLFVFHPLRPVEGFLGDIQEKLLNDNPDLIQHLYSSSIDFVKQSFMTDLMFLSPPSQIAAACIYRASIKHKCQDLIERYFRDLFNKSPENPDGASEAWEHIVLMSGEIGIKPTPEEKEKSTKRAKRASEIMGKYSRFHFDPLGKEYRDHYLKTKEFKKQFLLPVN